MSMRTKIETFRRIGRAVCGLTLACLSSAAFAAGPSQHEIRLVGRSWTPAAGVSQEADRALAAQAQAARQRGRTHIHALIQLHEIPDESQRNDLARSGIELGSYVPGNAWIATIPVDRAAAVARRPEVRWVEPWTADHKLHPRLAAGQFAPWARDPEQPGWIAVMVLLHEDVDLSRGAALAERAGGTAGDPVEGLHGMSMWIPAANLNTLAAEEEVLWIEQSPPPLSATNDGIRSQMKINSINSSPYDLDGDGVRLFVFDVGAVRASHESFNPGTGSRVTVIDNSAPHAHSTHVAGTAAGDGSGSPSLRGRGVASAVDILSAGYDPTVYPSFFTDAADFEGDYATARNIYGADLANNSLGSNIASRGFPCTWEGDYATTSALLDKIVRGNGTVINGAVISVWANGNERGGFARCGANYQTTGEPACAKNPIHVGAINSDGASMTRFSSWGPCSDGRLKPTIVAPGCESGRVSGEDFIYSAACHSDPTAGGSYCSSDTLYAGADYCGTSMAAPAVSGAISLLLQDWRQHLSGIPSVDTWRPLPALVKAALIQTARDLGPEGPDYRYGYGAVDARALIDFERAAGTGGLGGPGLKVWGTSTLTHGSLDSFTITVPAGTAELKASLAWDDVAAAPFAALALVNDLDLELVSPRGKVYQPFFLDPTNPHLPATTADNHLDNQEQVLVKNPQAGIWTVRVRGTNIPQGGQLYGLVYGATPQAYSTSCTEAFTSFESVLDSWTMTGGAARVPAPAPGHGTYSAQLGGADNTSEVKRQIDLPLRQKSTWSFDLYMTTTEVANDFEHDELTAEVRSTNGNVLAVLSFHNDGDVAGVWLPERNIDLTPWAGQTVYLVFRAVTSLHNPTTFWVDDVRVTSCPSVSS
jgi:Subtilase family